jgi:hypothetical protein
MGLYKRKDSSYYWYKFEYKGVIYRGSTSLADREHAEKIAAMALQNVIERGEAAPGQPGRRVSYNYLILNRRARCVKIGYSEKSPEIRLRNIQTSAPDPLELLGYWRGSKAAEETLHDALSAYHERGEWFRVAPELVRHLESYLSRQSLETLESLLDHKENGCL